MHTAASADMLPCCLQHVCAAAHTPEVPPDHALGIKDSVPGVHGNLVLGCIANQTLCICESNIAGGGAVALQVARRSNTAVCQMMAIVMCKVMMIHVWIITVMMLGPGSQMHKRLSS